MKKTRERKTNPREPRNEIKKKIAARKKAGKKAAQKKEFINSFEKELSWTISMGNALARILDKFHKDGATDDQILTASRRSYKYTRERLTEKTADLLLSELTAKERTYLKDLMQELSTIRKKQSSEKKFVVTRMGIGSVIETALWRHMTKGIIE